MKRGLLAMLLALAVLFADIAPAVEAMSVVTTEEKTNTGQEAEKNGQFLVKINYGIDSLVSYNANAPVQVVITNQGEDFTGELTLTIVREYGKDYGYSNDISIPAGTTKSSFLTIPSMSNMNHCIVRILDEDENIMYERKIMNALQYNSEIIIGVISDDYAALNYLDGMTVQLVKQNSYSDFRIGQMTEETMPDIASALSTCRVIVIDNFDTSKLSDAQYQALRQWVENGGLLIVGTGTEGNKTLSKFKDDFISGSVGQTSKKQVSMTGLVKADSVPVSDGESDTGGDVIYQQEVKDVTEAAVPENTTEVQDTVDEALSELEDAARDALSESEGYFDSGEILNLDILDISVDGGTPVKEVAGGELFIEKQVGIGKVIVCKTSLSMEPFSGYASNINVIAGLINAVMTTDIYNVMLNGSNSAYDNIYINSYTVGRANGAELPKPGKYTVLFIIYIILVGPGVYLVLKWKDKNKALWVAVPMLALLFTVGVYIVSTNDSVRRPILTSYNVERYDDASKTTVTGMSLVNPKSRAYEVNLDSKYKDVRPLDSDDYYSSIFGIEQRKQACCMIKEKVDHTVLKFDEAQAFTEMYMQAVATEATEQNIDISVQGYRDGFSGTVTNRLGCDIVNVLVYVDGHASYFDRIPAGETVEIKKDSSQQEIYDLYSVSSYFLPPDAYERDRKSYNRINDMGNVLNTNFYNLAPGEGFIACYKDGVKADVSTDKRVEEYSEILTYKNFNVKYADVKGNYSSNIHKDYLEDATYTWDFQSCYTGDYDDNEVLYNFGKDGINTLYYIGVNANYGVSMEVDCYIWNPATEVWDSIFADKDEEVDLKPYFLDRDNSKIRLKFSPPGVSYDGLAIPTIAGGEN